MNTRRTWTGDEFLLLVSRYPEEGPSGLALDLGRSERSITSAASRFRLTSLNRRARQAMTRKLMAQGGPVRTCAKTYP